MSNKEKTTEVTPTDTPVEETKEKIHTRLWNKKPVRYAAAAIAGAVTVLVAGSVFGGSDETTDSDESDTSEDPQD